MKLDDAWHSTTAGNLAAEYAAQRASSQEMA
jgi:hypothetical protein